MTRDMSAREYVQRLKASVSGCGAIEPEDRTTVPSRSIKDQSTWLIGRGLDARRRLFDSDPDACSPFTLVHGGQLRMFVRIREVNEFAARKVRIESYRICVEGLQDNPNQIESLRYDKPAREHRGTGWDEDLDDNPEHPRAHLHINFHLPDANDCRMPTGSVCPILVLRAFNHWYCSTFGS